eukprot:TRINITY_DN71149_c0_g1_i1.p1 TRINITY_DN71149_c0_g1~~TRINITY_DN71149_c0_g1_i1.p1  ORF type:complete len:311 (-),score=81.35 TRINITY_DN71149_c0_g1_i1:314-1246(-)
MTNASSNILTVAAVLDPSKTLVCHGSASLQLAAGLLAVCDRTSTAAVDDDRRFLGVLTENDILNAYVQGVDCHTPVAGWLQSSAARLPAHVSEMTAVSLSTPLADAAAQMQSQAVGDFGSHHLVVNEDDGSLCGILSALDLSRALCGARGETSPAAAALRKQGVDGMMKTRAVIPSINGAAMLREAFEQLARSKQNCLLVSDGKVDSPAVVGVVTTRDAVNAFSEQVDDTISIEKWLQRTHPSVWKRMVRADASLVDAAEKMVDSSVHHLLIASPSNSQVILGVVSSADLAKVVGSRKAARGSSLGAMDL